jgi:hypothetical protein
MSETKELLSFFFKITGGKTRDVGILNFSRYSVISQEYFLCTSIEKNAFFME